MKRKTFRIIFILFTLLCFAAFCGLQLQIRNQQATRQWADFVYWLGDEPQNLQQLPAKNGTYTFRFHADAEWIQQTATTLRLQQQPHTEAQPSTLYTADSARSLTDPTTEWAFLASDIRLEHHADNSAQLSLTGITVADDRMNQGLPISATHTPPTSTPNDISGTVGATVIFLVVLAAPFWLPAGCLLMCKGFNFSKRSHTYLWYILPLLCPHATVLLLSPHLSENDTLFLHIGYAILLIPALLFLAIAAFLLRRYCFPHSSEAR